MDMKLNPQSNLLSKQLGGTVLGIIVGVLVGLGAALAVAVYVTKVPVPFVTKSQPRVAEQDAAENKKNKDWDPNAPLYGKHPAKSAPGAAGAVVDAPAAAQTTPGKPATAASAAKASAKADVKISTTDPLGDLAKAKITPKPAATASAVVGAAAQSSNSGVEPFSYFVQAGAYRTPEDAETQRVKLSLLGMEAKVTEREQSGRTVYRVRMGPFNLKDDADRAKEKLDGNGIETAIVRVQR
jgi:cell division protein FtsN